MFNETLQKANVIPNKLLLTDTISEQPPEIITEIFKSISGGFVMLPPRYLDFPWVLGHVCSRWRDILWASPSIWNNIIIERRQLTTHSGRSHTFAGRAIQEPLNHIISKTTFPLSLTVKDGNADSRLNIILSHAGRFRDLSFDYISPEAFVSLLNLPPYSFSLLEKFSAMTFIRDISLLPNAPSLKTAPHLRSVSYRIMDAGYIPQCLFLPFENMSEIVIQRMLVPLSVVQRILLSCPCLAHCGFVIRADETTVLRRRETLRNLKTLHLETSQAIKWRAILKSFLTPALEDFSISSPGLSLDHINSLLANSSCPLKHLSLVLSGHNVDSTDPLGVDNLISQIPPSIVSLNLSWIASGLVFWRVQHGLLPTLEKIRLNIDANGLEALVSLVDSRAHQVNTEGWGLRKVELCCWADSEVVEQYKEWAKSYRRIEGFEIAVFDSETGIDIMDHLNRDDK